MVKVLPEARAAVTMRNWLWVVVLCLTWGSARAGEPVAVALEPGWNLVAFQSNYLLSLNGTGLTGMAWFDGQQYHLEDFTASAVNRGEATCRAFWVLASTSTQFTYLGVDGVRPSLLTLRPGWNLVAFPASAPFPAAGLRAYRQGKQVALATAILPQFQELSARGSTTAVDVSAGGILTPGRGYWVFAAQAAQLAWGDAVPGAEPSPTPFGGSNGVTRVTSPERDAFMSYDNTGVNLSGDGRFVFCTEGVQGLLVDLQTGALRRLGRNTAALAISRDGGSLLFSLLDEAGSEIGARLLDRVTGVFEDLAGAGEHADTSDRGEAVAWSPEAGLLVRRRGSSVQRVAGVEKMVDYSGPRLSADGRYLAYVSDGLYLRDVGTGETKLIAAGNALNPVINADGSFLLYTFRKDDVSRDLRLWSRSSGRSTVLPGTDTAAEGAISRDGRFVAFETGLGLVPEDVNLLPDIYVRDRQTGALAQVSVTASGGQVNGGGGAAGYMDPSISDDGRIIVFNWASLDGRPLASDGGPANVTSVYVARNLLAP